MHNRDSFHGSLLARPAPGGGEGRRGESHHHVGHANTPAQHVSQDFSRHVSHASSDEYYCLRTALERTKSYDFIFFDAPPSFGSITLNVLLAATEILLPVPLTYLALDGAAEISRTVEMVRSRFDHPELVISLVVPTFARRTRMAREILEKLRQHFPGQLSKTVLGYSVSIDEAQSRSKTIFEHAPRSKLALGLSDVAEELLAVGPRVGLG